LGLGQFIIGIQPLLELDPVSIENFLSAEIRQVINLDNAYKNFTYNDFAYNVNE
jgi:hypothetical protein